MDAVVRRITRITVTLLMLLAALGVSAQISQAASTATMTCTADGSDSDSAPDGISFVDYSGTRGSLSVHFDHGNVYVRDFDGTPASYTGCGKVSSTATEYPNYIYADRPETMLIELDDANDLIDVSVHDSHEATGYDTLVWAATGNGDDTIRHLSGSSDWPTTIRFIEDGGNGDDELHGGNAIDSLLGGGGADELYGEGDGDTLEGDDGADVLDAGAGDDKLSGGDDDDTLTGGDGNDELQVYGTGNDLVEGDDGDDTLIAGKSGSSDPFDYFSGGDGSDTVDYSASTAAVTLSNDGGGNDGQSDEKDTIEKDIENVVGSDFNDTITWNLSADLGVANSVDAGVGDDTVNVQNDGDTVADNVNCNDGTDSLFADSLDQYSNCESVSFPAVATVASTPVDSTPAVADSPPTETPALPAPSSDTPKTTVKWSGVSTVKLKKKKVSAYVKASGNVTGKVSISLVIGKRKIKLTKSSVSLTANKKKKFTATFKKYKRTIARALRKKKTRNKTYLRFSFSGRDTLNRTAVSAKTGKASTTKKIKLKRK